MKQLSVTYEPKIVIFTHSTQTVRRPPPPLGAPRARGSDHRCWSQLCQPELCQLLITLPSSFVTPLHIRKSRFAGQGRYTDRDEEEFRAQNHCRLKWMSTNLYFTLSRVPWSKLELITSQFVCAHINVCKSLICSRLCHLVKWNSSGQHTWDNKICQLLPHLEEPFKFYVIQ